MHIETIPTGPMGTNCFIAWGDAKQALVVDPGADADLLADFLSRSGLSVAAYPLTHGHFDHICGLIDMLAKHRAPVGLHAKDEAWAFTSPFNQYPPDYLLPETPPTIDRHFEEGQVWTDGGLTYRILETPGHSPGSVCLYFESEGVLISGDVLFQGSIGRTDLPGGDAPTLAGSLDRLMALPDETKLYPGHGPATTIGREKATNGFLLNRSWAT